MKKIMVVGGGGREHAITWKLSQSNNIKDLWVAPGNGGSQKLAESINVNPNDITGIVSAAKFRNVDLVVIGPEDPLALGIVDALEEAGIASVGPSKKAAQIEASKIFAKNLMDSANIPTAKWQSFDQAQSAIEHIQKCEMPIVIKADGLAAGKGVAVCQTVFEAEIFINQLMISKTFKDAGNTILIEECLNGKEASIFVLCDGESSIMTIPACDYKRIGDNDLGPNTGGMGSYSPPEFLSARELSEIETSIVQPTLKQLEQQGIPYKGTLYIGLMITETGAKVLEFNCRMGDPETQVILPRLDHDLLEIYESITTGTLSELNIKWSSEATVGLVIASEGYPENPKTGIPITGLDKLDKDILAFHSGTTRKGEAVITSGGRVLTLVSNGASIEEARNKLYKNVDRIYFEGMQYRTDIGLRAIHNM